MRQFLVGAYITLITQPLRADDALTVERAVDIALARNPELLSLVAGVQAAKARVSGAALPMQSNPVFAGEMGPRYRDGTRLLDYSAELSQEIEIFGQRAARKAVARAGSATSEARLRARRAAIAAEVRTAFARALAAEQLIAVERQSLAVATQVARAVEKRFEVGDGTRMELNTGHVEVGRATRAVSLAIREQASAVAALRILLAIDPETDVRLRGDLRSPAFTNSEIDGLLAVALKARADLVAARMTVTGARAQQTFAERDWLPRPRIAARAEREEGDRLFIGALQFDVPVFNRNQAARGVAEAEVIQAEQALSATERQVSQEVQLAALRLTAAQDAVRGFEGQVNIAMQENLALVGTAYEAGKIGLFEVLVIRRDTLDAQRGYIDALEELRAAEADLARTVGAERGTL